MQGEILANVFFNIFQKVLKIFFNIQYIFKSLHLLVKIFRALRVFLFYQLSIVVYNSWASMCYITVGQLFAVLDHHSLLGTSL